MTRRLGPVGCALSLAALLVACSSSEPSAGPTTSEASAPAEGTTESTTSTTEATTTTTEPEPQLASGPSAGCDLAKPAKPAKPGTTDTTMRSRGVERSYLLTVPEGYDGSEPMPLVLGLHALTVDYHVIPSISGFDDMAADHDFIVVSPSGRISTAPYWNAAPEPDNYDVAFIGQLLDRLEADLCIDTGKVFSIGMSNGAQMSSTLACRLDGRISAIGPIAGVEYNEPCPSPPTPVIAFHGVLDPIVPYDGGGLNSVTIADQNFYQGDVPKGTAQPTGVDQSMRGWAAHNGCDREPTQRRLSPEVQKRTWHGCDAATVLYLVDNGGHAWPGKPQPAFEAQFGHGTTDIDATDLMFAFMFEGEP